jgi:UDP-N-acetylmuramyl pentapeptide phosphotransferase/UDP-N-acetylglucosamine-1-phosphate transferase
MEFFLVDFIKNLPWWQLMLIAMFTAFMLTYFTVPVIVRVSKHLDFFERNNKRCSHNGNIPTLGGVAIFFGVVISAALFYPEVLEREFRYVLAALVILFFVGLKDDLLVLDPKKKFLAQLVIALIMILMADIRITTFHGFFNINEIPYWGSVILSIFVYVVIVNGFNLIDGIDGLASGVAILVSVVFAIFFMVAGGYDYVFYAAILTGSLVAFFRFNVFSRKNKLFLGDTGSLIIGFLIAMITISFLEFDNIKVVSRSDRSVPVMAFGILIVPLFDTLRVFIIRIFRGESPFQADRRHIHHRLLDLGFKHIQATLIIIAANLLIIGVMLLLQDLRGRVLIVIVLLLAAGLSYIPVYLVDHRGRVK